MSNFYRSRGQSRAVWSHGKGLCCQTASRQYDRLIALVRRRRTVPGVVPARRLHERDESGSPNCPILLQPKTPGDIRHRAYVETTKMEPALLGIARFWREGGGCYLSAWMHANSAEIVRAYFCQNDGGWYREAVAGGGLVSFGSDAYFNLKTAKTLGLSIPPNLLASSLFGRPIRASSTSSRRRCGARPRPISFRPLRSLPGPFIAIVQLTTVRTSLRLVVSML
jgi:hypothetical protein